VGYIEQCSHICYYNTVSKNKQQVFEYQYMESNQLGKKLKKLRNKLGLSQYDFARKADVPYTTLTKVETGVIKKPSVFVMSKIAKALNVDIENLIN